MKINILSREEFSKQFKKINEKSENQSYSYGCLMGYFKDEFKNPKINEDDIFNNEENEYGLEIEPHVTLLYGLLDDKIDENEIIKLFSLIECPEVSTKKISLFNNEKYDVVKWDIDSEELTILNKMVTSMFPFKSNFPEYHAHCTISYCKPGTGSKYEEEFKTPLNKKIAYWVYSKANGKKIKIVPGKESEIIREETVQENINTKDESFDYNGYRVNLKPSTKFIGSYMCSVYKDGEYKMGLRGPVSLAQGKEAAMLYINGNS